ncbi:hypothetical protein V6N13_109857 [Hibiscus sabdariffa]
MSQKAQMATTARDSRAQSSAGKVVAVQRTHHVARGKAVGVPISTEKDSVGQDSPVMVSEIKGVHIGGVKNVTSHETMVKTTSNLNSEKHVAVQGALDPVFSHSFKLLVKQQKSNIVVIMKPRISGKKADNVILKFEFEFSYRVEVYGFSGGIWLL